MIPDNEKSKPRFTDLAFPFRIVSGLLFAFIVGLTILQVFFRFVLDSPLIWSEEMARTLLVWLTFLGSAVLCWDGSHLNVDIFFDRLSPQYRNRVRIFNRSVALFFLVILVYYSIPLVLIDHMTTMSSFDIPASIVRVPATIGGGLMIAFIILRWAYRIRRDKSADPDRFLNSTDPM